MADNCLVTDVNDGKIVPKGRTLPPVASVEELRAAIDVMEAANAIIEECDDIPAAVIARRRTALVHLKSDLQTKLRSMSVGKSVT